ncbi:hypothetical protein ACOMHN_060385 [Nucella lapillus]
MAANGPLHSPGQGAGEVSWYGGQWPTSFPRTRSRGSIPVWRPMAHFISPDKEQGKYPRMAANGPLHFPGQGAGEVSRYGGQWPTSFPPDISADLL